MKLLLIGLGNPGTQYEKSRHNAGFSFLDAILQNSLGEKIRQNTKYVLWQVKLEAHTLLLAKPITYMNLSGTCLPDLQRRTGVLLKDTCVVCDNMDLNMGKAKLKFAGGSAGQKGLKNIIDLSGSQDFWRLYIGVGRPVPSQDVSSYVLGRFSPNDEVLYLKFCAKLAEVFLQHLSQNGFESTQQIINSL